MLGREQNSPPGYCPRKRFWRLPPTCSLGCWRSCPRLNELEKKTDCPVINRLGPDSGGVLARFGQRNRSPTFPSRDVGAPPLRGTDAGFPPPRRIERAGKIAGSGEHELPALPGGNGSRPDIWSAELSNRQSTDDFPRAQEAGLGHGTRRAPRVTLFRLAAGPFGTRPFMRSGSSDTLVTPRDVPRHARFVRLQAMPGPCWRCRRDGNAVASPISAPP